MYCVASNQSHSDVIIVSFKYFPSKFCTGLRYGSVRKVLVLCEALQQQFALATFFNFFSKMLAMTLKIGSIFFILRACCLHLVDLFFFPCRVRQKVYHSFFFAVKFISLHFYC